MTQPEGTRRRSFGRPSPSTVREVDSHAECFSTTSFRSGLPKRVEEQLEVERYGHRYFGRPVATFSYTSKTAKGWVKDRAIPVAPVTNKVTRKEEIANCAHRKARADGVQYVRSSTMTKVVEREKGTRDSGRQVQQTGSPLRVQKSATGQGQACQENKVAVQRQQL